MSDHLGWRTVRFLAWMTVWLFYGLFAVAAFGYFAGSVAAAECHQEPVTDENRWYNPTGWVGCEAYGTGLASRWYGPGVAVNACVYPWDDCTPIRITSLDTGISIVVRPTMYCNCWHGHPDQKLVDLDPYALRRLGLAWSDGVYPVRVEPAVVGERESPARAARRPLLPDTALR